MSTINQYINIPLPDEAVNPLKLNVYCPEVKRLRAVFPLAKVKVARVVDPTTKPWYRPAEAAGSVTPLYAFP
jgi:hypothetical protein